MQTAGLYHDWVPYLLAVAYVAIHHGPVGTLWPNDVYNHAAAIKAPWIWGGIHAFFILLQCIGSMIAWRLLLSFPKMFRPTHAF